MFTKNDIARGVVTGGVVLFLLFGFSVRAYSIEGKTISNPAPSSSSFEFKNIFAPNFNFAFVSSISKSYLSSGSFNFWGFFSPKDLYAWYQAQGGFQGAAVYALNVFLVVIQVLGQIARAVLGYLK